MLRKLVKFAHDLDKASMFKAADLVDRAIEKIAQMGPHDDEDEDLPDFDYDKLKDLYQQRENEWEPEEPSDFELRRMEEIDQGESDLEYLDENLPPGYTFIKSLADGEFMSLEDAMEMAQEMIRMHQESMGDYSEERPGQVLQFPGKKE